MLHEHRYAQELLNQRAYTRAPQGNPAAEAMGKSVLAYQIVSGLLLKLKAKVTVTEAGFEHLLLLLYEFTSMLFGLCNAPATF